MASSTTAHNYWMCACTMENMSYVTICQLCQRPKPIMSRGGKTPPKRPLNPVKPSSWDCPMCTYSNESSKGQCDMCGHEKLVVRAHQKLQGRPRAGAAVVTEVLHGQAAVGHGAKKVSKDLNLVDGRLVVKKEYDDVINFLQTNGGQFVDFDFIPDARSLFYDPNKATENGKVMNWRRPQDIQTNFKGSWTVFKDARSVSAKDICQGVLGNCWFISALSVLAETPEFLDNIVLTKVVCDEGVYLVSLCKDGRWTTIMLDDTFPCDRYNRLHYCQGKDNQLWVPLVEKAAAKLLGCYEALTCGTSYFGFSLLTGAPCKEINLPELGSEEAARDDNNPDFIWAQICSCQSIGLPMGASCGRTNSSSQKYEAIGLISNHAYSLLNVWEEYRSNLRLVQLRNPWGKSDWNLDWCDKSPLWTDHLKHKLVTETKCRKRQGVAPNRQQDGIFWLTFQDLTKYFSSVNVCEIRPDWLEVRTEGMLPTANIGCDLWLMRKIVVEHKTELTLTLYQDSQRNVADRKRDLRDLCIIVLRQKNNKLESVALQSERKIKESICCNGNLDRGTYVVVCLSFNRWNHVYNPENKTVNPLCVLAIHSAEEIKFCPSFRPNSETLMESLFLFTMNSVNSRNLTLEGVTVYYVTDKWSGAIAVAINPTAMLDATVKFDFGESHNMVSTRSTLCTEDIIQPNRRQVLNILSHADNHAGYRVQLNINLSAKLRSFLPNQNIMKASNQPIQIHEPIGF